MNQQHNPYRAPQSVIQNVHSSADTLSPEISEILAGGAMWAYMLVGILGLSIVIMMFTSIDVVTRPIPMSQLGFIITFILIQFCITLFQLKYVWRYARAANQLKQEDDPEAAAMCFEQMALYMRLTAILFLTIIAISFLYGIAMAFFSFTM